MTFAMAGVAILSDPIVAIYADLVFFMMAVYFWWLVKRLVTLPFKLPKSANRKDMNYKRPDGSFGMSDGILYLGNTADTGEEIWFNNSDARTHCFISAPPVQV